MLLLCCCFWQRKEIQYIKTKHNEMKKEGTALEAKGAFENWVDDLHISVAND